MSIEEGSLRDRVTRSQIHRVDGYPRESHYEPTSRRHSFEGTRWTVYPAFHGHRVERHQHGFFVCKRVPYRYDKLSGELVRTFLVFEDETATESVIFQTRERGYLMPRHLEITNVDVSDSTHGVLMFTIRDLTISFNGIAPLEGLPPYDADPDYVKW